MFLLNAEILRNMSIIAEDDNLLKRAAKYLRKLAAEKKDPTLMTEEEFFAKIDRAEKQPGKSFESIEELDKYIRNLWADTKLFCLLMGIMAISNCFFILLTPPSFLKFADATRISCEFAFLYECAFRVFQSGEATFLAARDE